MPSEYPDKYPVIGFDEATEFTPEMYDKVAQSTLGNRVPVNGNVIAIQGHRDVGGRTPSPSGKIYGVSHVVAGVYSITCKVNGRQYIGSSDDIPSRWRVHRARLNSGKHPAKLLLEDWRQYGTDKFTFAIIYRIPQVMVEDELIALEQKYLDQLQPVYNVNKTAGDSTGFKHSEDAKRKMREAKRRQPNTGNE